PGKGNNQVPFGPQITSVRAIADSGGGLVKPPLRPLAAWFVIAPTLFFLLRRLGLRALVASGIALAGLALGAWAISAQRLDLDVYRTSPTATSTVPAQWRIQADTPYPPRLSVFGLPSYLGPLGRDLSINLWSGLLDCSRPLLIFFLARRLGASARGGLIAAFAMGLTASTFLLHSWGNYPTTASQWCALLFLVLLVARFPDLRRPRVFAGLLALL